MNADRVSGGEKGNVARAPVEGFLATPEFKQWQSQYQDQMKALRYLQSGLAQQMLKLRGLRDMTGMQAQKVQALFQKRPKNPAQELANQPRRS